MFLQHDSTVLALLSSLNLFNGRIVPYSSTVMVELHQDAISGWYVQIHLKNSSDPNTQQMHTLTIPGTVHHLCHKSNFNKFIGGQGKGILRSLSECRTGATKVVRRLCKILLNHQF